MSAHVEIRQVEEFVICGIAEDCLRLSRAKAIDLYERLGDALGAGARAAEGSGLLSRPAGNRREGSNPSPPVFRPPYRYEASEHGPVTIYDAIDVGWVARVKESLPHKEALAAAMVAGLNQAAEREKPS